MMSVREGIGQSEETAAGMPVERCRIQVKMHLLHEPTRSPLDLVD